MLSRFGFTVEEVKDFENEVTLAIDDRANEIGGESSECILAHRRSLEGASRSAGNSFIDVARLLSQTFEEINELFVYPKLNEMEIIVYLFDVEILNIFSIFNAVIDMRTLIIMLESEVRTYGVLFEYFVSDIYVDMIILDLVFEEVSRDIFESLSRIESRFKAAAISVRDSVTICT
jgi:hypothetical protein